MPSFAFWKSSKPDESKSPLLSDAAVTEELSVIIPGASKAVDLNPGNQDSGVFFFDEDAQEIPGDQTPVIGPTSSISAEPQPTHYEETNHNSPESTTKVDVSLLDIDEPLPHPQTPSILPEQPSPTEHSDVSETVVVEAETVPQFTKDMTITSKAESPVCEPAVVVESADIAESNPGDKDAPALQSRPVSLTPKESGPTLSIEKRPTPATLTKTELGMRDRDSGVYLSEDEDHPTHSRPSSIASVEDMHARSKASPLSKQATTSSQRTNSIARLQRPAELNLGFNSASGSAKPRSELDLRYDLIRNSKTQSKAALRSPTQLLQDRLNMSPKKKDMEEKVRVFTPPRATVNGCMLPGPGVQAEAFTSTSVRAKTEAGGRPAWWCKFDKLVVFDGIEHEDDGKMRLRTRTSKGLSIARRLGDLETIILPLDCAHCHEMLNRHEWKYDMRVCKRSVCWDCKERCKWEYEQEKMASIATPRTDANRERADSMLQDEQSVSHSLKMEATV